MAAWLEETSWSPLISLTSGRCLPYNIRDARAPIQLVLSKVLFKWPNLALLVLQGRCCMMRGSCSMRRMHARMRVSARLWLRCRKLLPLVWTLLRQNWTSSASALS